MSLYTSLLFSVSEDKQMQITNNQTQNQKAPDLSPIIFERGEDNIVYVRYRNGPVFGNVVSVFRCGAERMKLIKFDHGDDGDGVKRTRYGLRSQLKTGNHWGLAGAIVWVALVEEAA
jgi:hypothetical protein